MRKMADVIGSNAGGILKLEDESDKLMFKCIQVAGICAVLFFAIFGVTLFVALGNEILTEDMEIYAIFMLVILPFCALSSFCATRRFKPKAAGLFVLCSFLTLVVTFSIMVADLVTPGCEGDVFQVSDCQDKEHQPVMFMVALDAVILSLLGITLAAAFKVVGRVRILDIHFRRQSSGADAKFEIRDPDDDGVHLEVDGTV